MVDMQCKLEEEEETWQARHAYKAPIIIQPPFTRADWYITRLVVKLTPKGVVFSFLSTKARVSRRKLPPLRKLEGSFRVSDPSCFHSHKCFNKVCKLAGKKAKGKERTIKNYYNT